MPLGLQSNLQTLMVLHCSLSQKHAPPSEHLLGMLKRLYILAKLLVPAQPAASLLTVPHSTWSSDTCDSSIRDQYFHDLLELQAASVSDQDEGLHD